MSTTTTEITSTELSRALSAHNPCCMYDAPGLTAVMVATLKAHGYPVADDVDEVAFTDEERTDLATRLEAIAQAVRTTERH